MALALGPGWRAIRRYPRLFLSVALPLAFGIGVATALVSLVRDVLIEPLPLPEPHRIVAVDQMLPHLGGELRFSPAAYLDFARESLAYRALAAYRVDEPTWTGDGEPTRIAVAAVTPSFFDVVATRPRAGRVFAPDELRLADPVSTILDRGPAVIVSDALWRTRFGGASDIEPLTLVLDGRRHRVVGVMPPGFRFPEGVDVWAPLLFGDLAPRDRGSFSLSVLGRLAPGTTPAAARADGERLAARLRGSLADGHDLAFTVVPLRDALTADFALALWVLLALGSLILLCVVANAVHLLLAHALARRREMAIRVALGGGRRTIVAQLLAHSLAAALPASLVGLVIAHWSLRTLLALAPLDLSVFRTAGLDAAAAGFAVAAGLLAGLLGATIPALVFLRRGWHRRLGTGDERGASRRQGRLQHALVAVQLALAVVLLVATALVVRSYRTLAAVDLSFEPAGVVGADLTLPEDRYASPEAIGSFAERAVAALAELPAARAAAAGLRLPVFDPGGGIWFQPPGDDSRQHEAAFNVVTPAFFRVLGLPLIAGRGFEPQDREGATPVVVISESVERQFFPERGAIGRELVLTPWPDRPRTIVGVVAEVRYGGLRSAPEPTIYVPFAQLPLGRLRLVARAGGDPAALVPALRASVRRLDPELAFDRVGPLEQRLDELMRPERFLLALVGLFGLLGLLLTATGVYTSTAYAVSRQMPEFCIRLALGGRPRDLVRHVLRQGTARTLAGLGLGTAATSVLLRYGVSLLYGPRPLDPATVIAGVALLLAVALVAALLPARRAARADPTGVLRGS